MAYSTADAGGTSSRPRTTTSTATRTPLTQNQRDLIKIYQEQGPAAYQAAIQGLLSAEKKTGTSVAAMSQMNNTQLQGLLQGNFDTTSNAVLAALTAAQNAAAAQNDAALKFNQDLALKEFALEEKRFAEQQKQAEFDRQNTLTQNLLEAAGLATGPTGAIQLAFMARGQGTPNAAIANMFSSLPFVKAALAGQTLPGFGVPEQLGGASTRIGGNPLGSSGSRGSAARTTDGSSDSLGSSDFLGSILKGGATFNSTGTQGTFGINLPRPQQVTEKMWSGMGAFEQDFLGSLFQAETGIDKNTFFEQLKNSWIPQSGVTSL